MEIISSVQHTVVMRDVSGTSGLPAQGPRPERAGVTFEASGTSGCPAQALAMVTQVSYSRRPVLADALHRP